MIEHSSTHRISRIPLKLFIWGALVTAILGYSAWDVYSKQQAHTSGNLTVSFLNVGQGDAIYIRAPNGADALIDAGPNKSILEQLHSVLPSHDTDLDVVIITHPDQDHIGGLTAVLDAFTIKNFITTEKKSTTKTFAAVTEKISTEPNINLVLARAGQRIILDKEHGVYLDILFPDESAESIKDTNEASIILELTYGESEFLFTGDAPESVELFLTTSAVQTLKTDVLKLGHHGSKTSSHPDFLAATSARYAIVSAGLHNKYGHPHREVVDRVNQLNMRLLSTATEGTITFTTDGITLEQLP